MQLVLRNGKYRIASPMRDKPAKDATPETPAPESVGNSAATQQAVSLRRLTPPRNWEQLAQYAAMRAELARLSWNERSQQQTT